MQVTRISVFFFVVAVVVTWNNLPPFSTETPAIPPTLVVVAL